MKCIEFMTYCRGSRHICKGVGVGVSHVEQRQSLGEMQRPTKGEHYNAMLGKGSGRYF